MVKQYIYKVAVNSASVQIEPPTNDELTFFTITNVIDFFKHSAILIKHFGVSKSLLKLFIKAVIARKVIYFTLLGGLIVSEGEVTFGHCNHYPINNDDCVIGPVNTNPGYQGKGIATFSLRACISQIATLKKIDDIYIDTKEDNFAMQKVIAKIGFGDKIGFYQRRGDL